LARERAERRLAAILAADVAGYSRLMGADEEDTLARLKAHRRELIDPKINEHRGRVVKTTGDGILIEFPSVIEAISCAVAVQREMAERNAGTPQDRRIAFRIGVNLGDIIVEDGDIHGDGVNIAARLEGIAEPGGICVSEDAFRQVRGKVDAEFDDLGEQSLKNIIRPLRVYRVRPRKPTKESARALPLPGKPSVAVLPFANISGDPEQEYFADGMVEEIITAISRIRWLFVIARNSSFAYKGKSPDLRQVGRELGVRYVLEGSMRKVGNRVRISSQLMDTTTGAHIWADRFDGSLDDIFELQDQVASGVVGAIEPKLRLAEIERASRKPPENLGVYDLYLRALALSHQFTPESLGEAVGMLRRALEIDPSYAPAAALSVYCFSWQISQLGIEFPEPQTGEVVRLAKRTIATAPDDTEVLWMLGWCLAYLAGENAAGATLIDRSLRLNPIPELRLGLARQRSCQYLRKSARTGDRCTETCAAPQPTRPAGPHGRTRVGHRLRLRAPLRTSDRVAGDSARPEARLLRRNATDGGDLRSPRPVWRRARVGRPAARYRTRLHDCQDKRLSAAVYPARGGSAPVEGLRKAGLPEE
jgi:adenylate cyclase